MKSLSIIASQIAILASISTVQAFVMSAWRVGDEGPEFHKTPINASSRKFFINRAASIYCPPNVDNLDCSAFPGPGTSVDITEGYSIMSLEVAVPGGQQVYIDSTDGSLSFTQAHSMWVPPGSIIEGFSRRVGMEPGYPIYLEIEGRSWYFCPVTTGTRTERVYQLFAFAKEPDNDECLSTQIRTIPYKGGSVWQYI